MNISSMPAHPDFGPARLPDFAKSTWFLAVLWPASQALLLLLHFRSYTLIRGEMTEPQLEMAHRIGLGCLVHLVIAAACVFLPGIRARLLRPAGLVLWIVSQIAVLWTFVWASSSATPPGLPPWLFEPMDVMSVQFMLTMPGMFLAMLLLATAPLPVSRGRDVGWSAAALFGPPCLMFFLMHLISTLQRSFHGRSEAWLNYMVLVAFILSSILLFGGLFRLLMWTYRWLLSYGNWAERLLLLAVAGAMPVGGLLLNRKIPFPFNFQYDSVYLLTCLNAVVLLLSANGSRFRRLFVWLLQCLTFSFTIYFFLVFVPFFPLAVPAIIVAGAGFLILAPAALFFIHVARMRRSYTALCESGLSRRWAMIGGLAAFLALPTGYLAGCWMDRQALTAALEHVYHPDSRNVDHFTGTARALRSLERLRDRKAGLWIPILTPIYHQIAFNGLVLPDAKMQHLYRVLSGQELELKLNTSQDLSRELGLGGSWRDRQRVRTAPNLPRATTWEELEKSSEDYATQTRTTWKFRIRNSSSRQDEFACQLELTPGAFVTGLRLKIGQEWVEGKLFEKKSALWIYEMIKSVQQDPALVVYSGRQEVSLRIFPLDAGQVREVELGFSHPKGIAPVVQSIPTPPTSYAALEMTTAIPTSLSATNQTHQVLWVPEMPADAAQLRKPRLVLLEDISTRGRMNGVEHARALSGLLSAKPGCPISAWAFHHEVTLGNPDWKISLPLPESMDLPSPTQRETGRNMLAVVSRALEWSSTTNNPQEEFPALILVSKTPPSADEIRQLASMIGDAVPDLPWLGYLDPTGKLHWLNDSGHDTSEAVQRQVFLASSGKRIFARQVAAGPVMWTAPAGAPLQPLQAVPPSVTALPPEDPWSKAALLHAWSLEASLNPWLAHHDWLSLVEASKAASVLLPETAWIVLERTSHWEKLQRVEQQKMGGDKELGIMETPEPGFAGMAMALALVLWIFNWIRSRNRCSPLLK